MADKTKMFNKLTVQGLSIASFGGIIRRAFLAVCLVCGLLSHPLNVFSSGPDLSGEPVTKEAIVRLTNEIRIINGLHELDGSYLLQTVAEERAQDMLQKDYFGHVSPTGQRASDVARRAGYQYKIIAENIAQGLFSTNQKLLDRWMRSPGHRKNILSPEIRDIGVAIIKGRLNGEAKLLVIQVFGLQSSRADATPYDKANRLMVNTGQRHYIPQTGSWPLE